MGSESTDSARDSAMDQLESFGLSSYAAETFVTLVALGRGTAKEVSEASAVPRTRVYDAVEELDDWDLVDVKHSSPREFRPMSVETTRRRFAEDSQRRIDRLTDAVAELEPNHTGSIQGGVWTVSGSEAVTERVLELVDCADEELVYATVDDLLTDRIVKHLQAAQERGISVHSAGASESARQHLGHLFDGVETFEPSDTITGVRTGRLAVVDGERILLSVLATDSQGEPAVETAIWATGAANSLVTVLKTTVGGQFFTPSEE